MTTTVPSKDDRRPHQREGIKNGLPPGGSRGSEEKLELRGRESSRSPFFLPPDRRHKFKERHKRTERKAEKGNEKEAEENPAVASKGEKRMVAFLVPRWKIECSVPVARRRGCWRESVRDGE